MEELNVSLSLVVRYDRESHCIHWPGPLSSDGYPVDYVAGEQRVCSRVVYGRTYTPLPGWARLHRLCSEERCISPVHHVLQGPQNIARRLAFNRDDLRGVAYLIRGEDQRKGSSLWDVSGTVGVALDAKVMKFTVREESPATFSEESTCSTASMLTWRPMATSRISVDLPRTASAAPVPV